jgi:hypothetical protein
MAKHLLMAIAGNKSLIELMPLPETVLFPDSFP